MRSKNICKFHSADTVEPLNIRCFVRESNPETFRVPRVLTSNRIVLIIQGDGVAQIDGVSFPISRGVLLFCFEGEKICFQEKKELELLYIDFYGTRGEELLRRFDIRKVSRLFPSFDTLEPFWLDSLSRAGEGTVDLAGESMLLYTFSRMKSPSAEHTKLLRRILDITDQSFSDPTLSLSSIADEVGYNPKYLSHLFKEKMGIGYAQYLRNMRIKHAITLFESGIDSVKNVAFLSGFSDSLYFSTVFKSKMGVSPAEYKRKKS